MANWKWTGGVEIGPNGQAFTAGSGSPESVVTATVGSLYLRTDGAGGTCLYVKETGSGNTGWVTVTTASTVVGGTPVGYIAIDITTLPGYPGNPTLTGPQSSNYNSYEFTGLTGDIGVNFPDGARGPFLIFNNSNFNLSINTNGGSASDFPGSTIPAKSLGLFYIDALNEIGLANPTGSGQINQGAIFPPSFPSSGYKVQLDNSGFLAQRDDLYAEFDLNSNIKLNSYYLSANFSVVGPTVLSFAGFPTPPTGSPALSIYPFAGGGSISEYYGVQSSIGLYGSGNITDGSLFCAFSTAALSDVVSNQYNPTGGGLDTMTVSAFSGFKVKVQNMRSLFSPSTITRSFYSESVVSNTRNNVDFDFYGEARSFFESLTLGVDLLTTANDPMTNPALSSINLCDATLGGFTASLPGSAGDTNGALYFFKNTGTANTVQVSGHGLNIGSGPNVFLTPGESSIIVYDDANTIYHEMARGSAGGVLSTEIQVNGVDTLTQTLANFIDSATVSVANPSGGNIQFSVIPPATPGTNKQVIYNNAAALAGSSSLTFDTSVTPKLFTFNAATSSGASIDSAANNAFVIASYTWSLTNSTGTTSPVITGQSWNVSYGGTVTPAANASIAGGGIFASSQDINTDSIASILGWQVLVASGENTATHGIITAIQAYAQNHNLGTTTTVEGIQTQLRLVRPSTMTTAAAIHCVGPLMAGGSGSAVATTYAQLLIEDPTNVNISTANQYAIKVVGGVVDLGPGFTPFSVNTTTTGKPTLNLDDTNQSGFFWDYGNGTVGLNLWNPFLLLSAPNSTFQNPFSLSINSYSISSNVLTINVNPAGLWVQQLRWWLSGFATSTFLNGTNLLLTVTDPVNGVLTGSFTHADVPLTVEAGVACMPCHCLVSYSGIAPAAPTAYVSHGAPNTANAGFLWVESDSDNFVFTVKSSNGSDTNAVSVSVFPYLLG